jgi:hypothetical protein
MFMHGHRATTTRESAAMRRVEMRQLNLNWAQQEGRSALPSEPIAAGRMFEASAPERHTTRGYPKVQEIAIVNA